MRDLMRRSLGLVLLLGVAACGRKEAAKVPEPQTGTSAPAAQTHAGNVVQVSDEMLRDLRLTTSPSNCTAVARHRVFSASSA